MQNQNVAPKKNVSFSSLNVSNTLRHIKFLTETELKLVDLMVEQSRLGSNGHNLATWHVWANGSIGYLINRSKESVRIAKEGLQARGIILVDSLTWEQQTKEIDGALYRTRTPYKQKIEFTPNFISWFGACIENRKIISPRQFGYCDAYIQKRESNSIRARLAKMRYKAKSVLISMCNSCETVTEELVRGVTNSLGTFAKIQSDLNTKDTNLNAHYGFTGVDKKSLKENLRNPFIANLSSYTEKKVKIWTDATTRICKQLMDSGMTKIEVARSMIHQNYVNSIHEFESKYSPPMNC